MDSDRGRHLTSASGLSMQAHMWAYMPAYVHTHANIDPFRHLSLPLTHGALQGLLSVFLNQPSKVQPKNPFASKVIQICGQLGGSKPSHTPTAYREVWKWRTGGLRDLLRGSQQWFSSQQGTLSFCSQHSAHLGRRPTHPHSQLSRGPSRNTASLARDPGSASSPTLQPVLKMASGGWMKVEAK